MARLEIDHVEFAIGDHRILHGVSLDVAEGECLALLGPSGCGKTTTLRAVAGFVQPTSGDIRVGGRSVVALPPHRRNLGLVFQDYALFPHMTVAENVGYGLRMRGLPRGQIGGAVDGALRLVRLEGMGQRYPAEMSGGQRQRVALARALVIRPDILLLDEPLAALDRKLRDQMQVELQRIRRETGITTVIVTHDQEEALSLADRVAVMFEGRIAETGRPAALYGRPGSVGVMDFLGEANLFPGRVRVAGSESCTIDCAAGFAVTAGPSAHAAGAAVTVGIRPEHVELADGDADDTVGGVVTERVYKGASLILHVAVAVAGVDCAVALSGSRLLGGTVPEIGASVRLRLPRAHLVVLG
jgi:ABC-type Fe3+/spermidine/putrescine transport system ATPase subunit